MVVVRARRSLALLLDPSCPAAVEAGGLAVSLTWDASEQLLGLVLGHLNTLAQLVQASGEGPLTEMNSFQFHFGWFRTEMRLPTLEQGEAARQHVTPKAHTLSPRATRTCRW